MAERTFPEEVIEGALWRFGPQDDIPEILRDKDREPFDRERLFCFAKSEICKSSAWDKVYAMSKKLKVKDEHAYKGWRKSHTKNYWAWYAYDLETE